MRTEGKIAILILLAAGVAAVIYFGGGKKPPIDVGPTSGVDKGPLIDPAATGTRKKSTGNLKRPLWTKKKVPTTRPTTRPTATQPVPNRPIRLPEIPVITIKPVPKPRVPEPTMYIVKPGDTLYDIAEMHYGRGDLYVIIKRANPQITDASRLSVGQKLTLPAKSQAVREFDEPALPGSVDRSSVRTYKVKAGESFYSIARDELGSAARWQELFELNKSLVDGDATQLKVGQTIFLPK